jgi:hypothetical protein
MTGRNTLTPLTCSECSGAGTYREGELTYARCTNCGHEVNACDFQLDEGESLTFAVDGPLSVVRLDPCGAYPLRTTCSRCGEDDARFEGWGKVQGAHYVCDTCEGWTVLIDSCECPDDEGDER